MVIRGRESQDMGTQVWHIHTFTSTSFKDFIIIIIILLMRGIIIINWIWPILKYL